MQRCALHVLWLHTHAAAPLDPSYGPSPFTKGGSARERFSQLAPAIDAALEGRLRGNRISLRMFNPPRGACAHGMYSAQLSSILAVVTVMVVLLLEVLVGLTFGGVCLFAKLSALECRLKRSRASVVALGVHASNSRMDIASIEYLASRMVQMVQDVTLSVQEL